MSPSLTIVDASTKAIPLTNFKGKVVLLEFLLIDCPHCSRVAQSIDAIQRDFGGRGFQAIGIALENGIGGPVVAKFAEELKISFPVGYASSDNADRYLGRTQTERFQVPQLVLVDREGVIRAQSRPVGENVLENPAYLRKSIDGLLSEGRPSSTTAWTSRVWTKAAFSCIGILTLLVCVIRINQRRQRSRAAR
jgi:peroxiredoxin